MDMGITLITPDMGAAHLPETFQIPRATVVRGTRTGTTMTNVVPSSTLTYLPQLNGDQVALVASELADGTGSGPWLQANVHQGQKILLVGGHTIGDQPADDIQTLLSGSAVLVANGKVCQPGAPAPCGGVFPGGKDQHAETVVGVSADGKTA